MSALFETVRKQIQRENVQSPIFSGNFSILTGAIRQFKERKVLVFN